MKNTYSRSAGPGAHRGGRRPAGGRARLADVPHSCALARVVPLYALRVFEDWVVIVCHKHAVSVAAAVRHAGYCAGAAAVCTAIQRRRQR